MKLLRRLSTYQTYPCGARDRLGEFLCLLCEKIVVRTISKGNASMSCGCLRKHGFANTPLQRVWIQMRYRCGNPKAPNYPNYGGRGIAVCEEWRKFRAFHEWAVANGYRKGLPIDRRDNNGPYSPDNCRFISTAENTQNSRQAKINAAIARKIRARKANGETARAIAKSLHLSEKLVGDVIRRRTWKNIL